MIQDIKELRLSKVTLEKQLDDQRRVNEELQQRINEMVRSFNALLASLREQDLDV